MKIVDESLFVKIDIILITNEPNNIISLLFSPEKYMLLRFTRINFWLYIVLIYLLLLISYLASKEKKRE